MITMPNLSTYRHRIIAAAFAAAAFTALSGHAATAQIVVMVNGSPVTNLDIEQRIKFGQLSTRRTPSRQDVINELIDDRLKLSVAKRYGIDVSDFDVDQAVDNMASRSGASTQQLTNSLVQGGVSINTLKAKIRADIAWSQLVRGRYSSSLQVGEADINKAILSRGAQTDDVGYNYTLYPITIILSANATQATLTTARQTADNLRNRFQNCKDGLRLARALRDVAVREPITRNSADLVPQLRELLSGLELGRLTPAESTPQGLQMFALCDKKETNADSAAKREIRDELFSKRFEAQGKKFLNEVRRSAMIEYR